MDDYNAQFDCTPRQYHDVIDKLWKALEITSVQEEDCFSIAAKEIRKLRNRVKELESHLELSIKMRTR